MQFKDERGLLRKILKFPNNHRKLVQRLRRELPIFPHSSAFYKTDVVKSIGGFRQRLVQAEDLDLWFRLSEVGHIACVDSPLVHYRVHDNNITHHEGGKLAISYVCIATASYWLRYHGFSDPVDMKNSDDYFNEFRNYIVSCLQKDKVFDYYDFVKDLVFRIKTSNSLLEKLKTLLIGFVRHPSFYFRYIFRRLFGSRLAKKYAINWIKRGRYCVE